MKKNIYVVLVFLMVPQLVFASHGAKLKELYDDYVYSMTVEWDQNDKDFASQKISAFEADVEELIAGGLTKADVLNATGVDVESLSEEVGALDINDSIKIFDFLKNHSQFKKGASWNGEVIAGAIGLTTFVVIIAIMVNRVVQQNNRFNVCVDQNGGNEEPCIDNPWVLGRI
jgi:hypothetical protein